MRFFLSGNALGKVVRVSQHGNNPVAALAACTGDDVLLFDSDLDGKVELSNPPDGLQVVGGKATWNIDRFTTGVVFFNHRAKIVQTGGVVRHFTATDLDRGSKFTHVDSSYFLCRQLLNSGVQYEVNGFMRATTFAFGQGFVGSSHCNLKSFRCGDHKNLTWTDHKSLMLINATHPVGDGSGSFIMNVISHNQIDWTPVHIINGRGITVSHFNSEYTEFADPFFTMENCVNCHSLAQNPGGKIGKNGLDWPSGVMLQDGTPAYHFIGARWGLWRIAGMRNSIVGGSNYTGIRGSVSGHAWTSTVARDPFFANWNGASSHGINHAEARSVMVFGETDRSLLRKEDLDQAHGYAGSIANGGPFFQVSQRGAGTLLPERLSGKTLRNPPKTYRPFAPPLPRIRLDGDGPGVNMTGKSGKEIVDKVNGGKTVYLGPGVYEIPSSLKLGTVYGAGMDKTIIKCAAGKRCSESLINLYNLTLEGGSSGFTQFKGPKLGISAANVRFKNQTICGMTFGNNQNNRLAFLEFEGSPVGIGSCLDGQICGEGGRGGAKGVKIIDKLAIHSSLFRNMTTGMNLRGGTDGAFSLIGCRFENISGTGANLKGQGNYVAGSDFINCNTAIKSEFNMMVHNSNFETTQPASGVEGVNEILSCDFKGPFDPAVETAGNFSIVSDVNAPTGTHTGRQGSTWIGNSQFSNGISKSQAFFGPTEVTAHVAPDNWTVDQTPPSAPSDLKVRKQGNDNVLSWFPSRDAESGILHYIIERKGQEVGRTNYDYSSDFHYLVPDGWANPYPEPGVYRNKTTYIDVGGGSFAAGDYRVVAVNFAQRRSDGAMAQLRLWPYGVNPTRLTMRLEGGGYQKIADTVRVPIGSLTTPSSSGSRSFQAVAYRPTSESTVQPGITFGKFEPMAVSIHSHPTARFTGPASGTVLTVYSVTGRKLGEFTLGDDRSLAGLRESMAHLRLQRGTYLIPALHRKFTEL